MVDLATLLDARIAKGELDVPVLPRAAQEVLRLASAEDFDLRRVADVIKSDPMLLAHVLRVVNTPTFRARSTMVSVQQALARLGAVQIRQVMYVIACDTRALRVRGREAEAERWLTHALDTAWFAQEIARVRRQSVEEAFLCGLLHDVGLPVLWQLAADLEGEGVTAERAIVDEEIAKRHAHVGGEVALRWELPPRVVEAIRAHHDEALVATDGTRSSAQFLRAALLLADALAEGRDAPAPAVVALDLYPEEVASIVESRRVVAEAA